MAKNIKKRIIIPPHWATVFLFAAICLLVFYAHAWAKSIESHDLTEKYETYCFGMTVVLISLLFHYGITPKGIVCMFLFIPFRLINGKMYLPLSTYMSGRHPIAAAYS